MALYIDDGLITASDQCELNDFLSELKTEFKIRCADANYFLRLEIRRSSNGIKIYQRVYAEKILEKYGFANCKHISTPTSNS